MSTVGVKANEAEREGRRARKRKRLERVEIVAVALRNAAKHAENGVPHETIARLFFEATGIHLKATTAVRELIGAQPLFELAKASRDACEGDVAAILKLQEPARHSQAS